MHIDEEHEYKLSRLKKTKENRIEIKSDHNTILLEVGIEKEVIYKEKDKTWNIKNNAAWDRYKKETETIKMNEDWNNNNNINYKYKIWKRQVKSMMYKYLNRITIKDKAYRNEKTKTIKKRRKALNSEIEGLKKKGIIKGIVHKILLTEQQELKKDMDKENNKLRVKSIETRMKKLNTKSSISNEIWKVRQQNINKTTTKLAVKSKEGNLITHESKIKERYQEYYKDLLNSREPKEDYEKYNNLIEENFKLCNNTKSFDNDPVNQEFTMKELEEAIKCMKKEKSPGQDELYNEIIINAGANLKSNILNMMNTFWREEQLPQDLYNLNIKSLYKSKGDTGNLENQRGIFLSSSILKLYEKMIMMRAINKIEEGMSDYQAGGRKDFSIAEPVFILRSTIQKYNYYNQPLILEFLDLRKAFDKMILKNVMQNLWDIGLKGRIWRNIYNINKEATIRIKTALGNTEDFEVGEILKQGSVLASNLAALHTDSISRRFSHTGLGANYGNENIPFLLY